MLLASASVPGRALTPNGPHPDQPPQREILLNGLRVATVARPGDRVAVVCAIRAGSMFDPSGKSGLANVTAGVLLRGAGSYTGDRIRGELDDAGATLTVRTDWDATWIEGEAPAAGLATVLDVMSLMVSSPRLAPEDVEAVKRAALEHVAAELADPNAVADRAFAKALYGKHTYGRSTWGDAASLAAIGPGDVKVFYDKFYAANASALGIAGPADADAVVALARARFGRWTKRKVVPATFLPPVPAAETRVVVVDRPGAARAIVRAGFWTDGRASATAPLLQRVAWSVCTGTWGRVHDVEQLRASYDLRSLQSPFVVAFTTAPDHLADAIQAAEDEIAAPVSPAGSTRQSCGPTVVDQPSEPLRMARVAVAADFFGAQKLAPGVVDAPANDAQLAAAKAGLRPSALTVVVLGDAKEITAALKARYKVEVVPSP